MDTRVEHFAPGESGPLDLKLRNRRKFLKNGAMLASFALGGLREANGQAAGSEAAEAQSAGAQPKDRLAYGERSRFEDTGRIGSTGLYTFEGVRTKDFGLRTPLQDSVGILTPAPLHFVISHGYDPPDIDPQQHRLLIHGLVDRPFILSLQELKRLPSVSRIHFIECNANSAPSGPAAETRNKRTATVQETHGYTSCSEWTGVPLSLLLNQAGVQKGAAWIVAEGAEAGKHTKSIPLEKATDDALVAYGQNGEALRPQQGYPLRLLVPGWEGINNVKWLRRIKVVDQPYMGMWESTKYPSLRLDGKARWFQFEMGPRSVITRPSGGQHLPTPGTYEISGLAWSGRGAIRRVEVSTDGGKTWKDAHLQEPIHRKAHTRFGMSWDWNGDAALLQSRCTDEVGQVQPTLEELGNIWDVKPDFWQRTSFIVGHFNAIQPWKVTPEGDVFNAIFS
jgi:sulfane dehydrogenase subunit SoxC